MSVKKRLEDCDWITFEKLIKKVLELHNFKSFWNVNLTINGLRRQFDVVANKRGNTLLIECKKWSNKKTRASALKRAVSTHLERCDFFKDFNDRRIMPLIITYKEDSVKNHEGVHIVPVNKLNNFLLNSF